MKTPEVIDRYFTEQVIGPTIVVALGPADTVRREPSRGVVLDMLSPRIELLGAASLTLVSGEPWRALSGAPVTLPRLRNARRVVVAAAVLAWSATLWGVFGWWSR
jgi:hypothetical protein